jgi:hypothetical protein
MQAGEGAAKYFIARNREKTLLPDSWVVASVQLAATRAFGQDVCSSQSSAREGEGMEQAGLNKAHGQYTLYVRVWSVRSSGYVASPRENPVAILDLKKGEQSAPDTAKRCQTLRPRVAQER